MKLEQITLHRLRLPLARPYKVAFAVYDAFCPIVAEVRSRDDRVGWGESLIAPGYTHETPEAGWAFCRECASELVGQSPAQAIALLLARGRAYPTAATALVTAIEMLEGNPILDVKTETSVALLSPVQSEALEAIPEEIESLLAQGFRTLKVKVGFDAQLDLRRVAAVQRAVDGRALIRLDANQGYTADEGRRFAESLEPAGIMLFEQPCTADDWEANAAVAAVSRIPVMLDESIYSEQDLERAAGIPGVGYVKLKLKKLISHDRLKAALEQVRTLGMVPVLGDGMSTELGCWMEACVARLTIDNAGEMNGFLKPTVRIFEQPLRFESGSIVLEPGFSPKVDVHALHVYGEAQEQFGPTRVPVSEARS